MSLSTVYRSVLRSPAGLFFVPLLLLCLTPVQAQDRPDRVGMRGDTPPPITLTGTVLDDDTGEPLPGASVVLRRASDATLATGGVTAPDGHFTIDNVPVGTYQIRFSYVGFASVERSNVSVASEPSVVDLGPVRLVPETTTGEGIEVTADRELMEVQIDRTVYNVKEQVTAIGGSASDVLQDLPSIEVDVDGSISYRGNENVAIHINGRPSSLSGEALASFLKSLSAESVERVEIIPNPSARYEPDGMAGILNIVLAKNRTGGWSGGLSAGAGSNSSYNGSANVGYQSGPLSLFTTYGYRYGTRDISGTRLRQDLLQSPSVTLTQTTADEHIRRSHAWTTQAEYQMASQTTLGLQTVVSARSGSEDGRSTYVEQSAGPVEDAFARLVDGTRNDLGFDTRLTFDQSFGSDEHSLTAELRYEWDLEDEEGIYTERALLDGGGLGDPFRRDTDQVEEDEQEGTVRVDYKHPMSVFDMETGYQGSLRRLNSDQNYDQTDLISRTVGSEIHAFGFDEQIHAAYGILSTEAGRFGAQAGLRVEQALTTFSLQSTEEAFDNDYVSLFPSAFLTYELTEGQQMRLSYSKRVNRPRLWQLNPVDDNEDRTFRRVGNPFLQPEYVHAFEASYVRHWNALTLTTSPYFRRTVNEIQWRQTYSADGITTQTFENFDASNSYGAELIAAVSGSRWLRGNVSVNGYRIVTDASNVDSDLSNDALGYSGRVSMTVKPREGLDVQLSQYYRSAVDIAGGRMGSRSMTTVGAKQELFNGRATVGLQARDVLGTMGFNLTRRDDTFYQEMNRDWGARQVSVSLTYNFGRATSERRPRDRQGGGEGFGEEDME